MSKQPLIENLEHIDGTKELIRDVLESKGIDITDEDTFRSYADKMEQLTSDTSIEEFKEVAPKTVAQTVLPSKGYKAIKKVTVKAVDSDIDEDLKPENIKKNVDILGVLGTYEVKLQKELEVNPSTEVQYIGPEDGFDGIEDIKLNPVTANIDKDIRSENIREGVNILGVEGTLKENNVQGSVTVDPETYSQEVIPEIGYDGIRKVIVNPVTSKIDKDIIPSNIRKGTEILGVEGELESYVLQYNKDIRPSTEMQYLVADDGADGVRNMTVYPVTRLIDNNIQPENILRGVVILGVEGKLDEYILENYVAAKPSKSSQTILPSPGYDAIRRVELSAVSADVDENIIPENIKEGATILGVTGTYDGVEDLTLQSKTVNPTSDSRGVDVTYDDSFDALKSVHVNPIKASMVEGLLPSIVKKGEKVLELTGTYGPTSQSKVVYPSLNDQTVTPDFGIEFLQQVEVKKVTSSIDSNISPNNIRDGVSILGVEGNFTGNFIYQSKRATLTTEKDTTYVADAGYSALSSVIVPKVTSDIDSDIQPTNIRKGIEILGVTGTYEPAPSMLVKYITPSTGRQVIYPDDGYAAMNRVEVAAVTSGIDSNIRANNIREGITILGVEGSMEPIKGEEIVVEPSVEAKSYTPSEEKNAILKVTVNPVTNTIDNKIIPENIKEGIEILGVEGTFNGSISTLQTKIVTPNNVEQIITADEGFDALSRVTVESTPVENIEVKPSIDDYTISRNEGVFIDTVTVKKVTSDIDANIAPENIKMNMSILGVIGTYEGEPTEPILSNYVGGVGGVDHYSCGVTSWTRTQPPGIIKTIMTLPSDTVVTGTSAVSLFEGLQSLISVPFIDFSSVTDMTRCFLGCKSLREVPKLNTSKVTDITGAFAESGLRVFPEMDFSNVTNGQYAFQRTNNNDGGLTYVPSNLGKIFPKITKMSYMFDSGIRREGQFITTLGNPDHPTGKIDCRYMLMSAYCPIEINIDTVACDFSGLKNNSGNFSNSRHIVVTYENGGYISNLQGAFYYNYISSVDTFRINSNNNFTVNIPGCTSISSAFLGFGSSNSNTIIPKLTVNCPDITTMNSAFSNCRAIELDIITSEKLTNIYEAFRSCQAQKISEFEGGGLTDIEDCFFSASRLKSFKGIHNLGKAYTEKTAKYSKYRLWFTYSNFPIEDIISILDNLYDLNISYNVANGGKLYKQDVMFTKAQGKLLESTEEGLAAKERAIAKGWNVVYN